MECGWERIYRRLEAVGRLDALQSPVQVRDHSRNAKTPEA
jgi:electron transport complex protein RnfC